jgi:ABC-type nitrate/sulfonate/bicarbonate transport system permease component
VNVEGLGFLVALGVLWQVAMSAGILKSHFLPEPVDIGKAMSDLAQSGALTTAVWHTLYVTVLGWLAAGALGLVLGVALGISATAWRFSMATVEFLRALPAIAFVPVAVLLLGFSVRMELVVVIYVSVWPVLINVIHGIRQVSPLHNDLGRMLHMTRLERVRRLILPTTAPFLVVGLQVSLALALALAVVAEMVGNPAGIGHELTVAQSTLQSADMFAYVIVVGLLGVVLNALFLALAAIAFPGTTAAGQTES